MNTIVINAGNSNYLIVNSKKEKRFKIISI